MPGRAGHLTSVLSAPSNLLSKKSRRGFFGSVFAKLAIGRYNTRKKKSSDPDNDEGGDDIRYSEIDIASYRSQVPSEITSGVGTISAAAVDAADAASAQAAETSRQIALEAEVHQPAPEKKESAPNNDTGEGQNQEVVAPEGVATLPEMEKSLTKVNSNTYAIEITVPKVPSNAWDDPVSVASGSTDRSSLVDACSVRTEDVHRPEVLARKAYFIRSDEEDHNSETQIEVVQPPRPKSIVTSESKKHSGGASPSAKSVVKPKREPHETIKTHVITNRTLSKMNWDVSYESLTIRDCVNLTIPPNLQSSIANLQSLKFAKLTSVPVLIMFLKGCPKLRKLTFANVTLVNKKTLTRTEIKLPELQELEITEWLFCLTRHDYWLLEFFVKNVKCPNLSSFTFRGTDNFLSTKIAQKCASALREIDTPSAVVSFILKHRTTLDKLSVGGLGFKMLESDEIGKFPELSNLNALTHVRVTLNAEGIAQILTAQTMLKSLTCYGFIGSLDPATKQMLTTCIENNSATLKTVGIFPCILIDRTRKPTRTQANTAYTFHCDVFQSCKNLTSLFMNITLASPSSTQRLSCGRIFNLPMLPTSISTLELYNHEFQLGELESLGRKLPKFLNLRRLVLSSDKTHAYTLKLQWIKSLFALPHFISVDFFGGRMDNQQVFRDYVFSKPRGFMTMVKIADCISFYRSAYYEPSVKYSDMGSAIAGDKNSNDPASNTKVSVSGKSEAENPPKTKSRIIRSNYQF